MAFADLKNDFVFRRIFADAKLAEGEAIGLAKGHKTGLAEGLAEGHKTGLAEGHKTGKIAALLAILAARRLSVTGEARARIEACEDTATLDRWIARAVAAPSIEDVFISPETAA
jgi:hypothetical protein